MKNWIFKRFVINYEFRYRESLFASDFMKFSKFGVADSTQYHDAHRNFTAEISEGHYLTPASIR